MQFVNIKYPDEVVSFKQALLTGIGKEQGLFFPQQLTKFDDINELLAMPFQQRCTIIYQRLLKGEFDDETISKIVKTAFNFPLSLSPVSKNMACLELFHGPTLAFKDFGCRFFAACIAECQAELDSTLPLTILTATSGDTGAAVAHAFHKVENVRVHVLYPKGKISKFQEQLFCTLGDNINTYAVEGSFDECQSMVKQAFIDEDIKNSLQLNSANSINVSRLLAQIAYYFEVAAQWQSNIHLGSESIAKNLAISVPSGNFGNLTAGLMAKALGAPIERFVIGTNANDTVPRYLANRDWQPHPTIETLANAMDISKPNNWPRIEVLCEKQGWTLESLKAHSFTDQHVIALLQELDELKYLSEPHAAIAYGALQKELQQDEFGVFLGTAHPAKFADSVESILQKQVAIPKDVAGCLNLENLSKSLTANYTALKEQILRFDRESQ